MIAQVSMLFQGHDDLLYGFNAFLPEHNRMPAHPSHPLGGLPPTLLPPIQRPLPGRDAPPMLGQNPTQAMLLGGGGGGMLPPGMDGPEMGGLLSAGGGGGPPQGPGEVNHAVNFVAKVKQRFARDPERYKLFLEVLHQYEENQPGTEFLTGTVAGLFKDSPDLLKEFLFFLPPQVQLALQQQGLTDPSLSLAPPPGPPPPQPPTSEPDMSLAVNFLNKVKLRFANERDKYQLFLELLHEYERGNIPPEEVLAAVNKLLVHHPDLCREFTYFLPETRAKMESSMGAAAAHMDGMQGGGMGGGGGGMPPSGASDALAGLGGGAQPGHTDVNFAMHFVNKVKARFATEPDRYTLFLNALLEYERNPNWPNTIIDVANQLFGSHPDLLRDFSFFLPRQSGQPMPEGLMAPSAAAPGAQAQEHREEKPNVHANPPREAERGTEAMSNGRGENDSQTASASMTGGEEEEEEYEEGETEEEGEERGHEDHQPREREREREAAPPVEAAKPAAVAPPQPPAAAQPRPEAGGKAEGGEKDKPEKEKEKEKEGPREEGKAAPSAASPRPTTPSAPPTTAAPPPASAPIASRGPTPTPTIPDAPAEEGERRSDSVRSVDTPEPPAPASPTKAPAAPPADPYVPTLTQK